MSSMVVLYPSSDGSSSGEESYDEKEDANTPMHDILKDFFTNENNENIATILTNLTKEIKMLRLTLKLK